ncbi:multiple sugar transport system permease protein [Nonomuraea solani]|uniref:Multiple sugar transport system permease protein n=1 Tax=Nonomuraea solani TaxID=1144553 RepID=A0A1H6E2K5_9ACTN|nr:sugar ABC transporter permease [Nonomuraea solani]SEG91842.1 multiple sugar transport system permease protein [Nonomuraea solani]
MTSADLRLGAAAGASGSRARWTRLLRRHSHWLFSLPAIAFVAVFFGYPIVQNVVMSFQEYTTATFYTGEAPWVGLANYVASLSSNLFTTTVVNTALFTIGSISFQFVIGLALALFFRRNFPLSGFLRSLLLLPWLLPLIASSAVWKWILDHENGVLNQFLGLFGVAPVPWLVSPGLALAGVIGVNIWLGIPFNVAILYSGLQAVPRDLYEAGSLDGAVGWRAFRHITWPNIRSVVSVVMVLGVVYTLKVVDIILGLTGGGPANSTQTLATNAYNKSFVEFNFGEGAALSNILIVVSLVFSLVYLYISRREPDE